MRLSPFLSLCGIALAVLLLTGRFTVATSATSTLTAAITIMSTCQTASTGALDLGPPDNHANYIDAQGSLAVACTSATPYSVALDSGPGTAGAATRQAVSYKLFSNSGPAAHGDNAQEGLDSLADTGIGGVQRLTVHGRIFPEASLAAHSDPVRVTISY